MKSFLLVLVLFSLSFSDEIMVKVSIPDVPKKFRDSIWCKVSCKDTVGYSYDTTVKFETVLATPDGVIWYPQGFSCRVVKPFTRPVKVKVSMIIGNGGTKWYRFNRISDSGGLVINKENVNGYVQFLYVPYRVAFSGSVYKNGKILGGTKSLRYQVMDVGEMKFDTVSFTDVYRIGSNTMNMPDSARCQVMCDGSVGNLFLVFPVGLNMYRCNVYTSASPVSVFRSFTFPLCDTTIAGVDYFIGAPTPIVQTPIHVPVKSTLHTSNIYDLRGKKVSITHSTASNILINKSTKVITRSRYGF